MRFFSDSKLPKADRLVLLVLLIYCISGALLGFMVHNAARFPNILLVNDIAGVAILLFVPVALWYASRHGSISLGQWGFSHGWGMWVNLGIVALCIPSLIGQLPPTRLSLPGSAYWMILGAFTEEVVFRVYLIRIVSSLLAPRKGHLTWAVFLSAALFTAMHLFRVPASQLFGMLLSSLIFGYLTCLTKSVLFAAFYHVLSNTGGELGLLGGGIAIAAYLVISLFSSLRRSHSTNLLGSAPR